MLIKKISVFCIFCTHITYVCVSRVKKCSFFGKFDVLRFRKTPVLRFAFLPYYRRILLQDFHMWYFAPIQWHCKKGTGRHEIRAIKKRCEMSRSLRKTKRKTTCRTIYIPQAFSDKVTPAFDFRDKPIVECDVLIVKKYFCRWLQIIIQVIIQNMIVNKLWCEYLMHCFWN